MCTYKELRREVKTGANTIAIRDQSSGGTVVVRAVSLIKGCNNEGAKRKRQIQSKDKTIKECESIHTQEKSSLILGG